MSDHREQLRAELVRAAERLAEPSPVRPPTRRPAALVLTAAAVLVVVAVAAAAFVRTGPASASVFTIERRGGDLVIDVVGEIRDPDEAAAELEDVGFSVALRGVPTPPSLVGDIVAISTEPAPGFEEAPIEADTEGTRVVGFQAAPGELGEVVIDYGRPADDGEPYVATETVPGCPELVDELLTDDLIERLAEAYGPRLRWQEVVGNHVSNISFEEVDDDARIVSILAMASDHALVLVTDGGPAPRGMECPH